MGCYLCSSATVCTECSAANNYEMDNNGDCICNNSLNFVQSSTSDVCVCNTGYYLDNGTCISIPLCPASNSGCLTCSGSVCSTCDTSSNFISDTPYCVCDSNFYFDGNDCIQCNTTQAPCQ